MSFDAEIGCKLNKNLILLQIVFPVPVGYCLMQLGLDFTVGQEYGVLFGGRKNGTFLRWWLPSYPNILRLNQTQKLYQACKSPFRKGWMWNDSWIFSLCGQFWKSYVKRPMVLVGPIPFGELPSVADFLTQLQTAYCIDHVCSISYGGVLHGSIAY